MKNLNEIAEIMEYIEIETLLKNDNGKRYTLDEVLEEAEVEDIESLLQ